MARIRTRLSTNRPWHSFRLLICTLLLAAAWSIAARSQEVPSARPTSIAEPATAEAPEREAIIPREPLEVLYALGAFAWPLGIMSIVVVWFSIERLVVLRRGRVIPRPFVLRFFEHLEQGKLDSRSALGLCEENRSPIALIFSHGIRKWGKPSVEVEQAIIDGGERQLSHLRKHLRVLNGASNVGPLVGLLGTVVGMIDSFNNIASRNAMGKTQDLAAGIGLALLTTAVGLLIAIPATIMYMYLAGRVDALVIEMDGYAQQLVDHISAEGLAEQARGRAAASTAKPAESRRAV